MTADNKFRILLADDHELLRDTLVMYLRQEADMDVVAVSDLDAAARTWRQDKSFDLVLLDYRMPGMDGLEGLKLAISEGFRVALISGYASRQIVADAMALNAAGFLPKSMPAAALADAIRAMIGNEKFLPPGSLPGLAAVSSHPLAQKLSKREYQVLEQICEGHSDKEIARGLGLQPPTVKMYLKAIYQKLGVSNRTQAALVAKDAALF